MRPLPWLIALLFLLIATPLRAGYTEIHLSGVDARVSVERGGKAHVIHRVTYRVTAGALRIFDASAFDGKVTFEEGSKLVSDDGRETPLTIVRDEKGILRGVFEGEKDKRDLYKRGVYTFELHYAAPLLVAEDGALERLTFAIPAPAEGVDGMRVTFDVPTAATEPRSDPQSGVLAVIRRGEQRDEVELVRPHVAKAEATTWAALVDPKAIEVVRTAAPPAPIAEIVPEDRTNEYARWGACAAFALLLIVFATAKARSFAKAAETANVRVTGIVGLRLPVRVLTAAVLVASGLRLQIAGHLLVGGALLALAVPLLGLRAKALPQRPRGPGSWVLAREATQPYALDGATVKGQIAFLGIAAITIGIAGVFVQAFAPDAPYLVAEGALLFVPIFFTGTVSQLPPSVPRGAHELRPILETLEEMRDLDVTPWVRVAAASSQPDEIRLRVTPRRAMAGVIGIEIGLAWSEDGGGWVAVPEVLVRVNDASFAASKMTTMPRSDDLVARPPTMGRRADERVYRLAPRWPTRWGVRSVVATVSSLLEERRSPEGDFSGRDRRQVPATIPVVALAR